MDKINFEEVFPILIFTCTINIRAPYRHSRACTPVTYIYATRDSPTPQSGSLARGQHLDKAVALRLGGHHYQGQTMLISSPGELCKQAAADIPVARCLWGSFEGTHNFYTHRLLSTGLGLNSKEEPWIYRMGLDLNTGSRRYSNLNHTRLQRHSRHSSTACGGEAINLNVQQPFTESNTQRGFEVQHLRRFCKWGEHNIYLQTPVNHSHPFDYIRCSRNVSSLMLTEVDLLFMRTRQSQCYICLYCTKSFENGAALFHA